MTPLQPGDQIPFFEETDQSGSLHNPERYKGKKLIIYFYPKDNTPACINQACSLRDQYQALRDKQTKKPNLLSLDEAKKRKPNLF